MNCDQLFRMLPDYLDEEMKRELCGELEAHMAECSYCRAHVHTMRSTKDLTHHLGETVVHQQWVQKLRGRILRGGPPQAD